MVKKATEDEVHAAIDGLVARGQEATCQAVDEKTGGSMTTVIKHMGTYQPPQPVSTAGTTPLSEEAVRETAEIVSRVAGGPVLR